VRPEEEQDLLVLLGHPGLVRLLDALHDSLSRHRDPKGRQQIRTHEEAEGLVDLIGKWVRPGGWIRVAEIDRLLRENTRFHCSLEEAVELHRGRPIVRPREERARFEAAREKAVSRCYHVVHELGLSAVAHARMASWMYTAEKDLRAGFRRWGEDRLVRAVRAVAGVFERSREKDGPTVFLAELANAVAEGPHAFDAGQPAGTLLLRALEYHYPETARRERRGSAAWKWNLLSAAGIARDPISVRVDTYGLVGDTPYLRELRRAGVDRPFTLNTLAEIGEDVRAWREVAFVVENPTVFAALIKHLREFYDVAQHPTLVCTNGNLNLADRALLDALCRSGAHLFYSGDFDPAGLEIAAAVLQRHGESVSPWRMTPADYGSATGHKEEKLDPGALQRVSRFFPDLVEAMSAARRIGYQESLIDSLVDDLDRFILKRISPPRRGNPPGGEVAVSSPAGTVPPYAPRS
jgi:uncharacterized protein (TIGR02679 family)